MRDMMPLPHDNIAPLDRIAAGVTGLRIVMVNVYAVRFRDDSWVLVDTGLPFSANRMRAWAEGQFGPGARPSCIILTHGHFDHVGAVEELSAGWDVPVFAHPLETPYLTGRSKYPPPDPTVGGGLLALLSPLYPKGPIDLGSRLETLPEDGSVPGMPGWRWIHTPGHTAGHVSLFRDDDRVLLVGDAFVTTKQESLAAVATQRAQMHGPPAYFTSDWEAAKLSVGRLAGLTPSVAATGHGLPLSGPRMDDALEELAANFDEYARPATGRYVGNPAVTDERGVVSVPPSALGPIPMVLAGLAAAAALLWLTNRRRSG